MMLVVGSGLGFGLLNLLSNISTVSEYDYNISVSPNSIMLNQTGPIDFEFAIENTGKKDIKFQIFTIKLCRLEKNEYKCSYLLDEYDDEILKCDNSPVSYSIKNKITLQVNKGCRFNINYLNHEPSTFFDDKDKEVQIFVYVIFEPPLENKIINLKIY